MPIDLVKEFKKREKQITDLCVHARESYRTHNCYKSLKNRYIRLRDSNDMIFGSPKGNTGNWNSKLSFPIVKTRALIRKAIISQNFRGKPLITVEKAGNTSIQNARNVQDLVNHNLKATQFLDRAFQQIKNDAARWGAACCYSVFQNSVKEGWKTVKTDFGVDRQFGVIDESQKVLNVPFHILNYIQEPEVSRHWNSRWNGHQERVNLPEFIAQVKQNPSVYIRENVEWVVKEAKKSAIEDVKYWQDISVEITKQKMDKTCLYIILSEIEGNEDDLHHYYVEMIGDKIVRFQHNPNDFDLVPYSIFTYYPRDEYWWGNSDSEFVLPHENFTNFIMGAKGDNALRALQQYIFYSKGSIDPSDWNNRRVNGGLIGVDLKDGMSINNMLAFNQFQDTSINTVDSIMREVKANQQELNPRPQFTNPGSETSPLANTTATAANILEAQNDVLEADLLEAFASGLKEMAHNDIVILTQRLSDAFQISPDPQGDDRILKKYEIMGNFRYNVETSLTKNKASELQRLENFLTFVMNIRGTQDPAVMNIQLSPIIENILRQADIGDVDEIYPAQPAQPAPQPQGLVPSAGIPGQAAPPLAGNIATV